LASIGKREKDRKDPEMLLVNFALLTNRILSEKDKIHISNGELFQMAPIQGRVVAKGLSQNNLSNFS
jgi:hypothetical protein